MLKITQKFLVLAMMIGVLVLGFVMAPMARAEDSNANAVIHLNVSLQFGSRGDAVKALQTLLAADPSIFSGANITGYYGNITAGAVKKFQKKHGIPAVGRVGPMTLQAINDLFNAAPLAVSQDAATGQDCVMIPPGHLIAPGFIKNHGAVTAPTCQVLPPGILKKLGGTFPPTGSDHTAPVISSIMSSNIGANSALITWTTDEDSTSQVSYGTTTAYGSSTTMITSMVKLHSVVLSGLSASTMYHYQVSSKDAAGNNAMSADFSFTTMAPDTTMPVISVVASSNIATTSAKITWTTDELATTEMAYGTTTAYGTASSDLSLSTSHQRVLTGLTAGTTYHYQVSSKDASGNIATSADFTFVTLVSDITPPVISSISASDLTTTGAKISWTTDEMSTTEIAYGTTASYGSSANDLTLSTSHQKTLVGLTAGTVYHYKVTSKDASLNTSSSVDLTFTTVVADTTAPVISAISVSAITGAGATVSWTTDENSTSKVYYSTTTPLNMATAFSSSNSVMATSHSVVLVGLSATTHYYVVVESADASTNASHSTEQTFITI
jgi:hypothetical protein